ncbi:hypothetical protein IL306_001907 [Fusarium sp. DS 682]|nr:hypothetical protein IL306_001907 [Fusarium sp. DS 682]
MADDNAATALSSKPEAKPVNCHICNKSFPHKASLRRHRQSKHPVSKTDNAESGQDGQPANTFNCTLCNQSFPHRFSLRQHQRSKHTPAKPETADASAARSEAAVGSNSQPQGSSANEASASVKQEDAKDTKDQENAVICTICDRSFNSRSALAQHKRNKHGAVKTDASAQQEIKDQKVVETKTSSCPVCDRPFVSRNAMRSHLRSKHAPEKKGKHRADGTEKKGKRRADASAQEVNAKEEEENHDGFVDLNCQFCNKDFPSFAELSRHQRKDHIAKLREKIFSEGMFADGDKSEDTDQEDVQLETTNESATQETKTSSMHQCTLCDRSFRFKSALVQHGLIKHAVADDTVAESSAQGANTNAATTEKKAADDDEEDEKPYYKNGRYYGESDYEGSDPYSQYERAGGYQYDFPAGIQAGDIDEDVYDRDFRRPVWELSDSDDDLPDLEGEDEDDAESEGPPSLCTYCNKSFPLIKFEPHQFYAHGIRSPTIIDVQNKVEKDTSYGPRRTVCKMYPKDFPFFFETTYFLRDCHYKNCGQSFETGTERINHEVEAHNRCITCELYFRSEAELRKHQSNSKVVETVSRDFDHWLEFAISTVAKETEDKAKAAQRQARNPDPNKKIECITCERKFEKASEMMQHVEGGGCDICVDEMDIAAIAQNLFNHGGPCVKRGNEAFNASVKSTEDAKPSSPSPDPAMDSTPTVKQKDLKQEEKDEDPETVIFPCTHCNKSFNRQHALSQHRTDKHGLKRQSGSEK